MEDKRDTNEKINKSNRNKYASKASLLVRNELQWERICSHERRGFDFVLGWIVFRESCRILGSLNGKGYLASSAEEVKML